LIEKVVLILQVITYFALIPIVYRALLGVDFSKVFKKNHVKESQLAFFIVLLALVKLIGDFFLDIMKIFLTLMGINL
jgi:uncharacterized membrane protein YwzB